MRSDISNDRFVWVSTPAAIPRLILPIYHFILDLSGRKKSCRSIVFMHLTTNYEQELIDYLQNEGPWKHIIKRDPQKLQSYLSGKNNYGKKFLSPLFEYREANQRYLKALVYKNLDPEALREGFNLIHIEEIKYIFFCEHGSISFCLVDPFEFFRVNSESHLDLYSIEEFAYLKLLFDIFSDLDIRLADRLRNYVFYLSKFFGFYPYQLLDTKIYVPYSTLYSISVDIKNICSDFCLETGDPIANGVFKNRGAFSSFNSARSSQEVFFLSVINLNKSVRELINRIYRGEFTHDGCQASLRICTAQLEPDKVDGTNYNLYLNLIKRIDECKEQIFRKIEKIIEKLDQKPTKGICPDGKILQSLLNKKFKSSYAREHKSRSKDEQVSTLEMLSLTGYMDLQTIKELEQDQEAFYMIVDSTILLREKLSRNKDFENHESLFSINFITEGNRFVIIDKRIDPENLYRFLRVLHLNTRTKRNKEVKQPISKSTVLLFQKMIEQKMIEQLTYFSG